MFQNYDLLLHCDDTVSIPLKSGHRCFGTPSAGSKPVGGVSIPLKSGHRCFQEGKMDLSDALRLNPFEIRASMFPDARQQTFWRAASQSLWNQGIDVSLEPLERGIEPEVSIPLKSGHRCFTGTSGKRHWAWSLNPFEIRASMFLDGKISERMEKERLNPFEIRASMFPMGVWSEEHDWRSQSLWNQGIDVSKHDKARVVAWSQSLWNQGIDVSSHVIHQHVHHVSIPLKSGHRCFFKNESTLDYNKGLNPFEIRASMFRNPTVASHRSWTVSIPLKSGHRCFAYTT